MNLQNNKYTNLGVLLSLFCMFVENYRKNH